MEYRKNQKEIIDKIVNSFKDGKKLVVLNAPTGAGKTIINLVSGKMMGGSYITSPLRVLVEQVKNDLTGKFKSDNLGWAVIGRDSYPCGYLMAKNGGRYTADGAPCQSKKYVFSEEDGVKKYTCPVRENGDCSYYNDRDEAMVSINSITTFDYFIRGIYDRDTGVKRISENGWMLKPLLTIDEAHFLPNKLADFYSINITAGGKNLPDFEFDYFVKLINDKINGLTDQKKIADITIDEFLTLLVPYEEENTALLEKLEDDRESSEEGIDVEYFGKRMDIDKAIQRQQKLVDRLSFYRYILQEEKIEWVFNMDGNGIYWKPYSPAPFVEKLWQSFNHIILSSATFFDIPEYLKDLGLDKYDYEVIDVDSTFDPEKGAIISMPGMYLNMKNFDTNINRVVENVDKILEDHKDERGIIHCHTYRYQNEILKRSKYKDRFIVHSSKDRQKVLTEFTNSTGGNGVLLSVNMGEGIDLIDDKARFQIIVKAPYPFKGDPWVKLHYDRSKRWYKQQTIIEIMQTCGRIIRSKDDWGITYLIDSNILSLLNQSDIPEWFMDRLKAGDKLRKKKLLDGIFDLNI